jgi:hypothetical protein
VGNQWMTLFDELLESSESRLGAPAAQRTQGEAASAASLRLGGPNTVLDSD